MSASRHNNALGGGSGGSAAISSTIAIAVAIAVAIAYYPADSPGLSSWQWPQRNNFPSNRRHEYS